MKKGTNAYVGLLNKQQEKKNGEVAAVEVETGHLVVVHEVHDYSKD